MVQSAYEYLLERADEVEERTIDLLLVGCYEAFLDIASISTEIWSGKDAEDYKHLLKDAVESRNRATLAQLPEIIRKYAEKLSSIKHLSETQHSTFSCDPDALKKKALEIDLRIIDYILVGDFDGILLLVKISDEIWSGDIAKRYNALVSQAVKKRNLGFLATIPNYLLKLADCYAKIGKAQKDTNPKITI